PLADGEAEKVGARVGAAVDERVEIVLGIVRGRRRAVGRGHEQEQCEGEGSLHAWIGRVAAGGLWPCRSATDARAASPLRSFFRTFVEETHATPASRAGRRRRLHGPGIDRKSV